MSEAVGRPSPTFNKKLRLVRSFLRDRPILCTWQLSRCGQPHCLFCENRLEGGEEWAALDDCRRIVDAFDRWGTLIVSLGGADPFLHPSLATVVGWLARSHFPVLTTHGWGVDSERAAAVWAAGLAEATVVIHDGAAAEHDLRVGHPGAHARAVRAIGLLQAARRRSAQVVSVRVPVGREGLASVERALALAAELKVPATLEAPLPPLAPLPGIAEDLIALKRRHAAVKSSPGYLSRFDEALGSGIGGCRAGRRTLHVDQQGRVSRCPEFRGAADLVGDLRREDDGEILRRARRLADEDGCRRCWRPLRGELENLRSVGGLLTALPQLVRR